MQRITGNKFKTLLVDNKIYFTNFYKIFIKFKQRENYFLLISMIFLTKLIL